MVALADKLPIAKARTFEKVVNRRAHLRLRPIPTETRTQPEASLGLTDLWVRSGVRLTNLHRWYDPNLGRWMSPDPIGFAAGDSNLYRYVSNRSTSFLDPTGNSKSGPIVWLYTGSWTVDDNVWDGAMDAAGGSINGNPVAKGGMGAAGGAIGGGGSGMIGGGMGGTIVGGPGGMAGGAAAGGTVGFFVGTGAGLVAGLGSDNAMDALGNGLGAGTFLGFPAGFGKGLMGPGRPGHDGPDDDWPWDNDPFDPDPPPPGPPGNQLPTPVPCEPGQPPNVPVTAA